MDFKKTVSTHPTRATDTRYYVDGKRVSYDAYYDAEHARERQGYTANSMLTITRKGRNGRSVITHTKSQ